MKRILSILFLLGVLTMCFPEPEISDEMNLTIQLLGTPQCIYLKSPETTSEPPDSQSCVEYAFDQDNRKLILKHLNAGFNCCPESLWCTVIYRNDTIIIQEFEKNLGCKCDCLYDLDIELNGLEPGKYILRLIEPYLGTQKPLIGLLDFQVQKQGSFCVLRSNYPWGL